MTRDYDVIIVGGGLAGATFASALAEQTCRIAVIESVTPAMDNQPSYDDRGLALSIVSQQILSRLGLWQGLSKVANPIRRIHVSDRGHFGFTRLNADTLNLPALGYVVIARIMGRLLIERLQQSTQIDYLSPATVTDVQLNASAVEVTLVADGKTDSLGGRLLVAADGTNSRIRELLGINARIKDYGQIAIVTNITPGRPHADTAYERFTEDGPLAFLPLTEQRCAVVHTVKSADAEDCLAMTDDRFLARLQERFGWRLGRLQRPGARKSYPIRQVMAMEQIRARLVILGNSAHTVHPNSAQGFNLCLRDIASLAGVVAQALQQQQDPGDHALLTSYWHSRQHDQNRTCQFTDGLATLFYNSSLPRVLLRDATMLFTDVMPPLKRMLIARASGLHGSQQHWLNAGLL